MIFPRLNIARGPVVEQAYAEETIRGFARRSMQTLGNFWVDLTRCVVYILLPLSIVVGLVLIACGTPR